VARAAPIYEITVTITDLTTPAQSTSFLYTQADPNNTSATDININAAALDAATGTTGVAFNNLTATSKSQATGTELDATVGFTMAYTAGPKAGTPSTDHYVITVQTTHDTYTLPPAATSATLGTSTSGSYTFTTAGNTQKTDSYYSPTNTANDKTDGHAGPAAIAGGIPVAGASNASGSSPTLSTNISPYLIPYALTNVLTIDITGNAPNATTVSAASVTTLASAVPEPASMVVFLTGMPIPLVVLGLLRRRRRGVVAG
jgi:hypothetical protein